MKNIADFKKLSLNVMIELGVFYPTVLCYITITWKNDLLRSHDLMRSRIQTLK